MFFELIATIFAGLGSAGLMLLLNRLSGGRLPKWAMPVAAGLAMLGYAVWSEMTWATRTARALPEGVEMVDSVAETYPWKPWTYLAPQVTRFVAADRASIRNHPDTPEVQLIDLYFHARWQPVQHRPQLVDCAIPARADVTVGALADPAGQARWVTLERTDPLIRTLCSS